MKTTCPSCSTTNDAVGFNLTDKEIINLRRIGLSEHLCKTCYNKELSTLLAITKAELAPLNEQVQATQFAYYKAHDSWKAKADLFKAIDYNMSLIKHEDKKKEASTTKKAPKTDKVVDVDKLAQKILGNLSMEQQLAIMQAFQANLP